MPGGNVVIINPISGPKRRGSATERVRQVKETFERLGVAGEIRLTERQNHAYELAQEAVRSGAALVVAWGGDGTINEVASALAFGEVPLGIIASGSGNGLARELGIDPNPERALRKSHMMITMRMKPPTRPRMGEMMRAFRILRSPAPFSTPNPW